MRSFAPRIDLLATNGDHLRFVPAAMAKALVDGGGAEIAHQNSRIRAIKLVESAATSLVRIEEPSTGTWHTPPFSVREKLDTGHVLWRHHRRCTYE
jgi:hypothetical protein